MATSDLEWGSLSIDTLVGKFERGEILLPEIQRAYEWKPVDVVKFFDSLYRGYPVGTLLLWKTFEAIETRQPAFTPSTQSAVTSVPQLLLDGQQRLTSLLRVMRGEQRLLFNLEHPQVNESNAQESEVEDEDSDPMSERAKLLSRQTFQTSTPVLEHSPTWIRVQRVFDGADFKFLAELKDRAKDEETFDKWQHRIENLKKIPACIFQIQTLPPSLNYEQIADIFVRVNSGGTRLGGTDLALAQVTCRWPGSLRLFEQEVDDLKQQHFELDVGFMVRAIVVCATNSCRLQKIGDVSVDALTAGWERAKVGLRRAVQFIRDDALIDSSSLLKSKNAFLPLVMRFGAGPDDMLDAERRAWIAWFYLAQIWGRYSSAGETRLDQDLATIADPKYERIEVPFHLQEVIRQQFGRLLIEPRDLDQRYGTSPRLFMLYVVARERNAVCWGTGMTLSLAAVGGKHDIEEHHIFPKAQLQELPNELRDNLGNIAFIRADPNTHISSTLPRTYLSQIVKEYGEERLTAQCVPTESEYWEVDFYNDFLEERRKLLADAINDRLTRLGTEGDRA